MPTITITIEVPDAADVSVSGASDAEPDEELTPAAGTPASKQLPGAVEKYWKYLSDNGRALYSAAAAVERESGPGFTLNDVAEKMDRQYTSAQSIHRTTGRSARKWKDDTGTDAPIRLEWMEYNWDDSEQGMRTSYRLPEGVADKIATL